MHRRLHKEAMRASVAVIVRVIRLGRGTAHDIGQADAAAKRQYEHNHGPFRFENA